MDLLVQINEVNNLLNYFYMKYKNNRKTKKIVMFYAIIGTVSIHAYNCMSILN